MSHAHLPVAHGRPLGNVAPPPGFFAPVRAPLPKTVPQSLWQEFDLRLENPPVKVKDQNGYGACNGHAAATSLEWKRWLQGLPHVDLSAWYIYAILCNGVDRGSSIAEALTLLSSRGVCSEADVPYGTINPNRLTSAAHAKAKRFTLEIGARLTTWDELMTACQLRRPFNFSIDAGGRFLDLDADGSPNTSGGVGNHAVTGGLGAKKCRNGEWAILAQNSWSESVQDRGFFWLKRRQWDNQSWRDAYDVVAVGADPEVPMPVLRS